MPITIGTIMGGIPPQIPANINAYNVAPDGPAYNIAYNVYIMERNAGIATAQPLSAWIASGNAVGPIQALLTAYGMNARNSQLVAHETFQAVINGLNPTSLDWINGFALPLPMAPAALVNPNTGFRECLEPPYRANHLRKVVAAFRAPSAGAGVRPERC